MENKIEWRMYFFVMYNLSGIQKGIQAGHAALEYVSLYGETEQYKDFIDNHKTFILLDGGGSGDMMDRCDELRAMGIPFMNFVEPDANNSISAIAFLVPSSIYDLNPLEVMVGHDFEVYTFLRGFRLASN